MTPDETREEALTDTIRSEKQFWASLDKKDMEKRARLDWSRRDVADFIYKNYPRLMFLLAHAVSGWALFFMFRADDNTRAIEMFTAGLFALGSMVMDAVLLGNWVEDNRSKKE